MSSRPSLVMVAVLPIVVLGTDPQFLPRTDEVIRCRHRVPWRRELQKRPARCRSGGFSEDIQLLVGTEERHRMVYIKPRREGSEFALVSIQMGRT